MKIGDIVKIYFYRRTKIYIFGAIIEEKTYTIKIYSFNNGKIRSAKKQLKRGFH